MSRLYLYFEVIKDNGKEFRIYKWNKPFNQFTFPKNSKHIPFTTFFKIDEDKLEQGVIYFIDTPFKEKQGKEIGRAYLYRNGSWDSISGDLDGSDGDGRVVVEMEIKDDKRK